MSEAIARQWLQAVSSTANIKDHKAHMALISKKVSLQGIPGYENIGYDEWAAQTQHEFEQNILKTVHYTGFKLITVTDTHIRFRTFETVEATDGTVNAQGVEMWLEREDPDHWRLIHQRVLTADETRHAGLVQ